MKRRKLAGLESWKIGRRRVSPRVRSTGWKVSWHAALLVCWLVAAEGVWAHVGAPYPVLLDEPVGPYIVSALADPDVGGGTFWVLIQFEDERAPEGTGVTLWAEPHDGHLAQIQAAADREETRYGERFLAEVPFDAEGTWQVRIVIDGPAGRGEAAFPVEVTPSGTGWLATVACLIPFVIAAALWLRGTLRRRTH